MEYIVENPIDVDGSTRAVVRERIVRCRDCLNLGGSAESPWCDLNECPVEPDGFCCWGDSKGGEDGR